ncbi:MAG: aldehyde dehydrogenase family protein, partial [Planctomycetota bacterium]|nr:aldehyde dehydrogenase family protein [Planctomycetota bacterium]
MKFYLAGQWVERSETIPVLNPFDQQVIDTVPRATASDIEEALAAATQGSDSMASLSAYDRFLILRKAADRLRKDKESLATTLSVEEGKTLAEARSEIDRSAQTLELSGEEAKRSEGEVLPLDAGEGVKGKLGFTLRVPCGVVVAISPFNFPLNLVCHKIGPAIAGGNATILKPASDTPLVAIELVKILLECGLPPLGISVLTGSGRDVGETLCQDTRVRKISFTGSQEVGERICAIAGLKKVTMELGSNSPLVVLPDADLDRVVQGTVQSGYTNAGQVCISAQRLIVVNEIHDELLEKLASKVNEIRAGNQLDESNQVGPMVRPQDAQRVEDWIEKAVSQGARLLCGGEREGALMQPTLLSETTADMTVVREELFGPAVAVLRATDEDNAIRMANDTRFGLSASLFTRDLDRALQFAKQVH